MSINPYDYEKECKRVVSLLKTEEGREAFKEGLLRTQEGRRIVKSEFGINIVDRAEQDSKPIVAILIPTHKKPENETGAALEKMIPVARESCHVILRPSIASSVVSWVRNQLVSTLYKEKVVFDYVLFMDDDMVPAPDTLSVLLGRKCDVIGAVCTVRQDPPLPNVRHYNPKAMIYQTADIDKAGTWKVGAVGTGFMLISKRVLEAVGEYTLSQTYAKKYLGMSDEVAAKREARERDRSAQDHNKFWFELLKHPTGDGELGEDVSFCFKAMECGFDIYADSTTKVGHIGPYPYSLDDYWDYRGEAIKEGKVVSFYANEDKPKVESGEKISVLVPTRGRPKNVERMLESLLATSDVPPEVILYIDDDDKSYIEYATDNLESVYHKYPGVMKDVLRGPRITLSDCWNKCAEAATGNILMVGSDDIIFRTKGWDSLVRDVFAKSDDKILMAFGDDGAWHERFATHPIIHRKWYEAIGYVTPPHFSGDYCDTWINDIAVSLGRRIYLPFVNEHMHPIWGKGQGDSTYSEKADRAKNDNVEQKYHELLPQRQADLDKLCAVMQMEAVAVG